MIKGNKIYLRRIDIGDTELILKWRNSINVKRFFIYQEDFTIEGHLTWLKEMVETGKAEQFIIYLAEENKPIGTVYLRDIDHLNSKAEFGIYIGEEEHRGKGYGKEATQLVIDYGFGKLALNRIFLRVLRENCNAINSYKRSGFKIEGIFRDDVKLRTGYKDIVFMSILRKDRGR